MKYMHHWSIQLHHKEERTIQGERKKKAFLGGGRGNAFARYLRHKKRRKAGCICNDLMSLLNNSEKNKHSSSSNNNNNNSNPQLLQNDKRSQVKQQLKLPQKYEITVICTNEKRHSVQQLHHIIPTLDGNVAKKFLVCVITPMSDC